MKAPKFLPALLLLFGLLLLSVDMPSFSNLFFGLLRTKLAQYNKQMPQEKVYLHLDKPFYKPGDAIWFQAYLVEGTQHKPSAISNVLYVELIDPKGHVEKKLTLATEGGGARGDFQLETAAPGGLYKIRAYTQWMQNFDEAAFFSREIQVQKIIKPKLLLKLDFEKDAYGPAEQVVATLKARDLEDQPIAGQQVRYIVQLAGREALTCTASSSTDGEVKVQFMLPDTLSTSDGLLNILVSHKGIRESVSRAIPIVLNKIDLQFFPEGGDLVKGMNSRVAFKALNEFGKPADVAGVILDEKGREVSTFSSFHKGMGAFSFTPEAGQQYTAKITSPVALATAYPLPAALPNGWGLGIEKKGEKSLRLQVFSPLDKPLYVVGQVRGEIYFTKEIQAKAGYNQLEVSLEEFPVGVAQFTLFDHQQLERCERLVFVNQHRRLYVDIETDKKYYLPREKVALKLRTYDEHQLPLPANLSLSVVDDKLISFADDKQDNILSSLLLSSDIKGKIEEPSFYFDPEEPKAAEALDYLLMTQAWRRFRWQEVREKKSKVSFYPEQFSAISGRVVHASKDKAVNATVTLVEVNNRRRAVQLKTKADGSFRFLNIDPTAAIQLFAKVSGVKKDYVQIKLDTHASENYNFLAEANGIPQPPLAEMAMEIYVVPDEESFAMPAPSAPPVKEESRISGSQTTIVLQEDVEQLSEVVVVGYGVTEQKSAAGSVVVIKSAESAVSPNQSLEQALQGRAAGVSITQSSGSLGGAANIVIRGNSSVANNSPLYVVDGFLVDGSGADGLSAIGFLSPGDIRSVTVLKSGEATAIYGARASNGVVLINTKSGDYYPSYSSGKFPDNYASLYIEPRRFSAVREFYSPVYEDKEPVEKRSDFRETLYWNPQVQTDRKGEASISFYNSDATTAFRITAEGIGANGYVGRREKVYSTLLPLSVEAKIPAYLSFEDKTLIPVQLTNNTDEVVKGSLQFLAPPVLKPLGQWNSEVEVAPHSTATYYLEALVLNKAGSFELQFLFENADFRDKVVQQIDVLPKGFPVEVSFSGQDKDKAFSFLIKDPVPGSLSAGFIAYPNITGDLFSGIESILQQPHGCFEQVSSSTYPNVLALQFMRETDQLDPAIEARALGYIRDGYRQLAAYETKEKGFEWYGNTPPHEGLTAFGLLEFMEMKKVWNGVNEAMLDRTRQWLLDRREGNGDFKQNKGKYGFAAASKEVNNAYIVYALAACGIDKPIEKEYAQAYQEALKSGDAYRLALLANAALSLKKEEQAGKLIEELMEQIRKKGPGKLKADHSLVRSYGNALQIETASLIALALLKEKQPKIATLQQLVKYLVSSRSYGGFGSTQGTIMALTALTEWAKFSRRTSDSGLISLYLNGNSLSSTRYDKGQQGDILMASLEKGMQPGSQDFRIVFDETREALPYSFNARWTSYTPASSKACLIDLSTKLSASEVKLNETVRLNVSLENRSSGGIPQTVAVVGIPSGLSVQPWQLKEYQEKQLFDFYEVRGNFVVFYYREMGPREKRLIPLDLKAEIPGTYQASASSAYLYYTSEHKDWEAGTKVEVLK